MGNAQPSPNPAPTASVNPAVKLELPPLSAPPTPKASAPKMAPIPRPAVMPPARQQKPSAQQATLPGKTLPPLVPPAPAIAAAAAAAAHETSPPPLAPAPPTPAAAAPPPIPAAPSGPAQLGRLNLRTVLASKVRGLKKKEAPAAGKEAKLTLVGMAAPAVAPAPKPGNPPVTFGPDQTPIVNTGDPLMTTALGTAANHDTIQEPLAPGQMQAIADAQATLASAAPATPARSATRTSSPGIKVKLLAAPIIEKGKDQPQSSAPAGVAVWTPTSRTISAPVEHLAPARKNSGNFNRAAGHGSALRTPHEVINRRRTVLIVAAVGGGSVAWPRTLFCPLGLLGYNRCQAS